MEEIDRLWLNRHQIIDERNYWRDMYYSEVRKNTEVLAGIPSIFTFEMSNLEEFLKEYPESETFNRFLNLSGSYELHGFGKYAFGGELKMRSTIDGLQDLTPIWKK